MKPAVLPARIDRMPQDASASPPYSPAFLVALALSTCDVKWAGKIVSEESIPVTHVLDTIRRGGWKIVPMERSDYESPHQPE